MGIVTVAGLIALAPKVLHAADLSLALESGFLRFGIVDATERACFLAQACHETAGFTHYEENLRYTSPARLDAMFNAVHGEIDASALIQQGPQAIANRVYAGRLGNGEEGTGDGWRFRGRGIFMLTGRANYRAAASALSHPYEDFPDQVAQPKGAVLTSLWFWTAHGCAAPARAGDVAAVTRIINGPGLVGQEERQALTAKAMEIFQ